MQRHEEKQNNIKIRLESYYNSQERVTFHCYKVILLYSNEKSFLLQNRNER